jgi:hypothetical protein
MVASIYGIKNRFGSIVASKKLIPYINIPTSRFPLINNELQHCPRARINKLLIRYGNETLNVLKLIHQKLKMRD